MSTIAELREDHAQLVTIVGELQRLIDQETPPPPVELFNVRSRLTGLLIAHLKAEDWVLYPPLLNCEDAKVASVARHFVDEMGGLAEAYARFNERWDALRIGASWQSYRKDAQGIIDALTSRIVRENRELYPLIEQIQRAA